MMIVDLNVPHSPSTVNDGPPPSRREAITLLRYLRREAVARSMLPLANDVMLRINDVVPLANDVMLCINDVALRANDEAERFAFTAS